ncbi:MAG: ion transporter [Gammaproteobacteria bacterium]|nr:ion transporter [Gammaproteobacteria bacterium]
MLPYSNPDFKQQLYTIIYDSHTKAGRWFDIVLIIAILASVVVVMVDSIEAINQDYGQLLFVLEWVFTIIFSIEYGLRIYCNRYPLQYVFSFFGIIDLLAILPAYLLVFVSGAKYMMMIRLLRILRVFRILKLSHYVTQANLLLVAISASKSKILVFLCFMLTITSLFGALMYMLEGPEHGFTSIPKSIYWAIVTVTTVGYGDISPQTALGQALSSLMMLTGYAIIAVPTGIFTAELSKTMKDHLSHSACPSCQKSGHSVDANYCYHCGARL